jgi:hypothetical protein
MAEKEKFVGEKLKATGVRLAFMRAHKAERRKNKKGIETGEPKFSATLLFDPTNELQLSQYKAYVKEARRALRHKLGLGPKEDFPDGVYWAHGEGNKLKKVYNGFKDMYYIKVADTTRPLLGNRAGEPVVEGQPQCPYAGCYVNAKFSAWAYDNESQGAGANFSSLQFVKPGASFGGGGERDAEEEFEALGDEPKGATSVDDEDDDFMN